MKRPMDVRFGLRRLRFSPKDSEEIAGIYRALVEGERDIAPWGIANIVCARKGLNPEIWHEDLTKVFAERKSLVRA